MSRGFRRVLVPALFCVAFLFTGKSAFADSIAVGDTLHVLNPGGTIFGGVFHVDDLALPDPVELDTFCVQIFQDINDTDYFIVGGISTVADDDDGPDPLDDRTAWIYSTFRAGGLSAYTENEIQAAIWQIEDEWTPADATFLFPGLQPSLNSNALAIMNAAQAAVAGGYVNQDVRVLNLFFASGDRIGEKAQDLLMLDDRVRIQSEAPEPATILLLGSGAAALIRRRIKGRRTA